MNDVAKPRVWLDCTGTYVSTHHTGIQRVVRNLVHYGQQSGIDCQPVVLAGRQAFAVKWDPVVSASAVSERTSGSGPGGRAMSTARIAGRTLATRLRKALIPRRLAAWGTDLARWASWSIRHEPANFQPGDILLLADTTWMYRTPPPYDALRRSGVQVGLCMYDMIPVTHPQFLVPRAAAGFQRWLADTIPQVDFFVAISRTVRDALRDYTLANFPHAGFRPENFEWFPLGVALDQAHAAGTVRPEVIAAFAASPPAPVVSPERQPATYLSVSTIEPRKNYGLLLDAFEKIWPQYPDARLCLVGRKGWLVDDLIERIRRHSRWGQQLFWFENLTDTELAYAYSHAKAFLFPSFVEGFGLPIVEALQYRLPVFASDTPIHREVAGDFAAYFDSQQPASLAEIIDRFETGKPLTGLRDSSEFRPMDWQSSVCILLEKCRQLAQSGHRPATRNAA